MFEILTYNGSPVYFLKDRPNAGPIIPIGFLIDHNPECPQVFVKTSQNGVIPFEDLRYANQSDEEWFSKNNPEWRIQMELKNIGKTLFATISERD